MKRAFGGSKKHSEMAQWHILLERYELRGGMNFALVD